MLWCVCPPGENSGRCREEMFSPVTQTKLNAYADDHQIYHHDVHPLVIDRYICDDVDKANQWYS